jgi:hypothetical protein
MSGAQHLRSAHSSRAAFAAHGPSRRLSARRGRIAIVCIYRALSVGPDTLERPDYYVTKTVLRAHEYGRAALPTVARLGFTPADYGRAGGVAVLRCTVMEPFRGFIQTLGEVMRAELESARR